VPRFAFDAKAHLSDLFADDPVVTGESGSNSGGAPSPESLLLFPIDGGVSPWSTIAFCQVRNIAAQAGGDPVVVVAFEKEADEAVEVEGDLLRDLLGTDPDHGECQIPGRPRCQAVRDIREQANGNRLHLSGSKIREIGQGFV